MNTKLECKTCKVGEKRANYRRHSSEQCITNLQNEIKNSYDEIE